MAYIPYGYRIEQGKAVPDREAEQKLRTFIACYLGGASIEKAAKEAELPVSGGTVMRLLAKGIYPGDDFYPPLLDAGTLNRVAEERKERYRRQGYFGKHRKKPPKAEPVKTRFCVKVPEISADPAAPDEKIAFLYSCIRSDRNGSAEITYADKEKLVRLMNRNTEEETICQ